MHGMHAVVKYFKNSMWETYRKFACLNSTQIEILCDENVNEKYLKVENYRRAHGCWFHTFFLIITKIIGGRKKAHGY